MPNVSDLVDMKWLIVCEYFRIIIVSLGLILLCEQCISLKNIDILGLENNVL